MTFLVTLQPDAVDDPRSAIRWIERASPERADAWFERMVSAIRSLSEFPRRCPLAPENDVFEMEIRQLIHEHYRIIFTAGSEEVVVLHIRHGARQSAEPGELRLP